MFELSVPHSLLNYFGRTVTSSGVRFDLILESIEWRHANYGFYRASTFYEDRCGIKLSRFFVCEVGATHPHPEPSKNADANFDRPMWSPTPKIEAAQGLMRYVARFGMDEEAREAIQMLSRDRSPAVRFQIASALTGLYEKNGDIFWQIAAERLKNENATGVLVEIARSSTHPYIARMEREVVLQWQAELLSRELPKERRGDVLNILANSLTHLYVFSNDLKARELLSRF